MTATAEDAESDRDPTPGIAPRASSGPGHRVSDRILDSANQILQGIRVRATALLDGPLDADEQRVCADLGAELAAWFGSIGLNAEANLARNVETLFAGRDANAQDAVAAAGLIDDIRSTLAASVDENEGAASAATGLLVIGDQTRISDSYLWIASRSGFACEIHPPLAHPSTFPTDVDLVLVLGSSNAPAALLRAISERYPLAPILGLIDPEHPRADQYRDWCATVLGESARPDEVTNELWWLHARANRELQIGTFGRVSRGFVDLVERSGGAVVALPRDVERIEYGGHGGLDAVILGIDVDSAKAQLVARRARAEPELRRTVIVCTAKRMESAAREELHRLGVDVVVTADAKPTNDELFAQVRALTGRVQRFSTTDPSIRQILTRTGTQIVGERMLVSADRDGRVVSVAVVELPADMAEEALEAAVEALAGDFRNHDVVGRWDERHLLVGLRGVPRSTGVKRIASALDRYGLASEGARAGVAEFPYDAGSVEELASVARDTIDLAKRSSGPAVAGSDWHPGGTITPDVMIVDPDTMLAKVLSSHLEDQGNTVVSFSSGVDALEWLVTERRSPPRVLLLEFHVPGVDGPQLLRQLRKSGVLNQTRVLMLSATTRDQDLVDAFDLGALDVINKPFSMVVFNNRVERVLNS